MDSKVNYMLVGLFVLVLGTALVTVGLWLGATRGEKEYDSYVAYFSESVSGLNTKAAVKYRGVEVGLVREIALDRDNPERVRILFDIERGTPVKRDTVAVLATQGITGLAFLDLTGGSRESPALKPTEKQPLPEIKTGPSLLVRLDTAVSKALADMSRVADHLSDVAVRVAGLLDDSNQQSISRTLSNMEQLTGSLSARVDGLGAILQNTAAVSGQMPALMEQVQQTVETINRTAGGVDRVLTTGQKELSRFSRETSTQMSQALFELQKLSEALRRLVQQLERNPNMLLLGRPRKKPGPGE